MNMMMSRSDLYLATGEYVFWKSIHWPWEKPCATSRAFPLMIVPCSLRFVSKTQRLPASFTPLGTLSLCLMFNFLGVVI